MSRQRLGELLGFLGLKLEDWEPGDGLRFEPEEVDQFTYAFGRMVDRLECTEAQAIRWRGDRDEAWDKNKALLKEFKMMSNLYWNPPKPASPGYCNCMDCSYSGTTKGKD